jgi:PAS domain S-box-containing protein
MDILTPVYDEAQRYRLLVEAVSDYAIYMLDPSGIVTSWNPGAERLKGYRPDEIIGRHFSTFYREADSRAGLPARALRLAETEGRFEGEGWRVRQDGNEFWANVVISPIRDASGSLSGFAKVTRGITERRKAEEALRRSEEQFRLLMQGVTDYAIYLLSPDGIITSWNAGAQRIKGYTPAEIIGLHFSTFYTEEDRKTGEPQRALRTAADEGRFEKEGWRVRKNGEKFWCHIIIDPIRDDNGEVIAFAKVTRDITERRNAQIALEQAREALFQSQKMEAIGQLTGGVAHDFNNLLMAIMGSMEILRRRIPQDPQLLRLVDNATQGAQRGAALTQRMLSFARRQELDPRPVDIPSLVGNMKELLQRTLGPGITIDTRFPAGLSAVLADSHQLELAILNLSVNSRDAMNQEGIIVISASNETLATGFEAGLPPGRYVCLTVTDTGEGMDEETLAKAMEPFFTTKGVGKGTGLGLSMVHGMAAQIGGRLSLSSRKGHGTTAELWLRSVDGGSPAVVKEAPFASGAGPQRTLRVLAVDDDYLVLFNTTTMLEELGHAVLSAS